jgi:phosphoribosylformylglycinamidine cyclo-ligase
MSLSYESSGVRYDQLDAFKRACQKAARQTTAYLAGHRYREPDSIRGESAYLIEAEDHFLAHVEEGLGTKNLIADAVYAQSGRSHYREMGIDTVATIVNDLVTCGALPISVAMHAAVGDSGWFTDERRTNDLVEGFAEGCAQARAVWGGGETPTLRGIVNPNTIVLSGSAVGTISPKSYRVIGDVRAGDSIIFLASSGAQTNGLTLCRQIGEKLPKGFATPIGDGRSFGEALLAPSVIYVSFVRACQERNLKLNYLSHITGHGWRKLMRLEEPFVYEIDSIRAEPALFRFIREAGPIDLREAYATFNMGVGFAAYVAPQIANEVVTVAKMAGYDAWIAGTVRKQGARKAVVVPALGIDFEGDTLQLR